MKAQGKVFKYGDNVDTDVIIPKIPECFRACRTGKTLYGRYR